MKESLILVTGGAGFVGSHVCERLVRDGNRVISLDNYSTGSEGNHVEGVEYRRGHTKDIETLIPEVPDYIFHLGEYARVARSLEEPDRVFDLNMMGTFGVLEFWRKKGGKFVYAGSSTKHSEVRVDSVLGRDLSPYAWSKAANSDLVRNYGRWYNLPFAITYFYNVYGPRERTYDEYGTVIETFRQCYLKRTVCNVRSPGTQTRAFTHVADTVEALILVAEKGSGDEYGISAKETYSLLDVAHLFGLEVRILPATASTRSSTETDTSKLTHLGWEQKHTLRAYIEDCKDA